MGRVPEMRLQEPLEGTWPCQHFDFSPVTLISDFWPLELGEKIPIALSHRVHDGLLGWPQELKAEGIELFFQYLHCTASNLSGPCRQQGGRGKRSPRCLVPVFQAAQNHGNSSYSSGGRRPTSGCQQGRSPPGALKEGALPAPGGSQLSLAFLGLSLCHSSVCLCHHMASSLDFSVSSCGLLIKTLDPV